MHNSSSNTYRLAKKFLGNDFWENEPNPQDYK